MCEKSGRLWDALKNERPLQVVGVINAYCALLAEQAGFGAVYLSGAGVANASYGVPDLGFTSLEDVLIDVRRITAATDLPLLVDADTGWEQSAGIAHTTRELTAAGASGMHLEDQVPSKRCGHRPGKTLVSIQEMAERIRTAVDARGTDDLAIMARTDAAASEGLEAAVDRARQYVAAGADMIFAEALTELDEYRRFTEKVNVPVLANLTEFGRTPLFTLDQLRDVGVQLALYPLSGFRAMSAAAIQVYETIRRKGNQQDVLSMMQTREQLYRILNYYEHEQKMDQQSLGDNDDHDE